jgi:U3 small nucleolar RNA-associated protein 19
LLAIERVFVDLIKTRTMTIRVIPLKPLENSSEMLYKEWLQTRYLEIFKLCLECLENGTNSESQQALCTLMKLLLNEGQFPLEEHENTHQQFFPVQNLSKVISKLLLGSKHQIVKFSEYTEYDDVHFYTWKILLKTIVPQPHSDFNHVFIQNFIEFLNVLIPSESNDSDPKFWCKEVKLDEQTRKRYINKAWNNMVKWDHNEGTQRQLLLLLLEKILVHLDKPQLLADYLMDSLDVGGSVSLLALQLIFILIHKYNMSYPNIYKKLYAMFEPECFHMKFKARLFYLGDIFLSSSFLPEALVAAFAKRLARLALVAPPQDIVIILYFIANLIIRHPGLKRLLTSQSNHEISEDPYLMEESDPNASKALESSLWEIQLLRNHMLPNICMCAKQIMMQPLSQEYNLGDYLELKENDVSIRISSLKYLLFISFLDF